MEYKEKYLNAKNFLINQLVKKQVNRITKEALSGINAFVYEQKTPINQLVSFSNDGARTLVLEPFDTKIAKEILKSIQKKDLGFNVSINDKNIIRVVAPQVTAESRDKIVKEIGALHENVKTTIRQIRKNQIKALIADKELSENQLSFKKSVFEKEVEKYFDEINEIVKQKINQIQSA